MISPVRNKAGYFERILGHCSLKQLPGACYASHVRKPKGRDPAWTPAAVAKYLRSINTLSPVWTSTLSPQDAFDALDPAPSVQKFTQLETNAFQGRIPVKLSMNSSKKLLYEIDPKRKSCPVLKYAALCNKNCQLSKYQEDKVNRKKQMAAAGGEKHKFVAPKSVAPVPAHIVSQAIDYSSDQGMCYVLYVSCLYFTRKTFVNRIIFGKQEKQAGACAGFGWP